MAAKGLVIFLLAALSSAGCLLEVVEVRKPDAEFERALRRIRSIERRDPQREGRPENLLFLLYEGETDRLVRARIPVWLLQRGTGRELDEIDAISRVCLSCREGNLTSEAIFAQGPGLILEAREGDRRILVWVE